LLSARDVRFGSIGRRQPPFHFWPNQAVPVDAAYVRCGSKTLGRVSTEMSLHVLAYNLKRVMKVLGVVPLIEAMRA
jgi:hypothetical protein